MRIFGIKFGSSKAKSEIPAPKFKILKEKKEYSIHSYILTIFLKNGESFSKTMKSTVAQQSYQVSLLTGEYYWTRHNEKALDANLAPQITYGYYEQAPNPLEIFTNDYNPLGYAYGLVCVAGEIKFPTDDERIVVFPRVEYAKMILSAPFDEVIVEREIEVVTPV